LARRFRFDFTSNRPLSAEEIRQIEDLVNARILENHPVQTGSAGHGRHARGAMMIRGKYDRVRLLSMADSRELAAAPTRGPPATSVSSRS
jgi:alanyl-tRNA synthetase